MISNIVSGRIWMNAKKLLIRVSLGGLLCCVTADSPSTAEGSDLFCMAEAIYFESRGEPAIGQLAVGITIKNRFQSNRYPDNICDVVRQGRYFRGLPLRDKCQFSYFCDGKPERITDFKAWEKALGLAALVLSSRVEVAGLEDVTHYHSVKVTPRWSDKLHYKTRVGRHLFYVKKRPGM
jgi:spore germination cell wall hydrolase CwlJ-like protein